METEDRNTEGNVKEEKTRATTPYGPVIPTMEIGEAAAFLGLPSDASLDLLRRVAKKEYARAALEMVDVLGLDQVAPNLCFNVRARWRVLRTVSVSLI